MSDAHDEEKDPLEVMDEADSEDGDIDPEKLAPGMHVEGEEDEVAEVDVDGTAPTDIDDPLMFDPLLIDKLPKKEKKEGGEEDEEEFAEEEEEDKEVDLEDEEFADAEQW